jgi:3-hydroxybutyryl-CoA dehydrogenase
VAPLEIRKIGVVGLGAMGAGIAQLAIEAGYDVVGREVSDELGEKARERIAHFLQRKVDKEQMSAEAREDALGRLDLTTGLADLADCDLVIEAIVEELGAKLVLFSELEGIVRSDTVLATNTSALSVTEIAAATSTPERVVGMHFFNPAPLMPLVEIVRAELSSENAVEAAFGVGERMGKRPIRCHDTPGFVVNRVLIPLLNEACFALEEGLATAEDIDTAVRLGLNHPMGPLTLADFIGLDTCLAIAEVLHRGLGDDKYRPAPLLRQYVTAGWLGRKSGRGFFAYT